VTPAELRQLVDGAGFIHEALNAPVDKDAMAEQLAPMRERFMRSVVASRDLESGVTLRLDDLAVKKPAGGLPAQALDSLVGRRLRTPLARDERVTGEALEPVVGA